MEIRKKLALEYRKLLGKISPKMLVSRMYKKQLGKDMNWDNPKDLNEKINWLKVYSDTKEWTKLADKYLVRDYIKQKGHENILVPLYGVWNNANEIDFESLPDNFVLKCNHGSGDILIVTDKNKINKNEIIQKYNKLIKQSFGWKVGEPHYNLIPPKIIVEGLLNQDGDVSESLIDYKIWCFHGKPFAIFVYYNRTKDTVDVETYDLNWNLHTEWLIPSNHFIIGNGKISKPKNFDNLLKIASDLSEGFPEVRVDFYIINDKIYFGELTFTGGAGYMDHFTDRILLEMGNNVDLSKAPEKNK